jgi:hypothetical protein
MGLLNFIFGKKEGTKNSTPQPAATQQPTTSRPAASASYAPKAAITGENPQRLFADKVEKAIIIANQGPKSVQDLQNALLEVYSCINKPGTGKLVTTFHDKQKLAECFMFMLRYDWMHDSDLREVWAENGLYCVVDLIRKGQGDPVEQAQYFMEMFMLLRWGKDSLIPKVQDLLNKSQMRNNPVFDNNDYKNGASYVISQFSFLTINGLRPLAQQDMRIIAGFMEACDGNAYFQECTKLDFYHLNPMIIFDKMKFVATIIGSILDDM